jgi:hypothetical protein
MDDLTYVKCGYYREVRRLIVMRQKLTFRNIKRVPG